MTKEQVARKLKALKALAERGVGGGAAKTGYYLLPVYTIIGNVLGRKAGAGGNQLGTGQDISPTLTANDRHAVAAPEKSWRQKYRVRSLTPLECERLDGFPDGWTQYGASGKEMSSNARIKALGNSIAVPCAERVFIGILAAEKEVQERKIAVLEKENEILRKYYDLGKEPSDEIKTKIHIDLEINRLKEENLKLIAIRSQINYMPVPMPYPSYGFGRGIA